ncbi:MAG: hypothetical protein H8K10_13085 [Nitrospira sp.]|nr:hypothetical protein [Nitrospira sp.]
MLPGEKRTRSAAGCGRDRAGYGAQFFIQLKRHETTITVRLLPATDPEKAPAVKKAMALVAGLIRKVYPASRYGKTNLQEYLDFPMSM